MASKLIPAPAGSDNTLKLTNDKEVGINATPSASSTHGSFPIANANDGSMDSFFATVSGATPPHWYQLDLLTPRSIHRYRYVTAIQSDYASGNYAKDWQIQYYDGAVWQTADTVATNTKRVVDKEIVAISARLWRIYLTATNGDQTMRAVQFELFEQKTTTPVLPPTLPKGPEIGPNYPAQDGWQTAGIWRTV